jgi:outer membrane protein assembly factor BamB
MLFTASLFFVLGIFGGSAVTPTSLWSSDSATVVAPPLVAGVHTSPGLEIICAEAYTGTVKAYSATGQLLWSFQTDAGDVLLSPPALSAPMAGDRAALAFGGLKGIVYVLDPSDGQERWRRETGAIAWGGVLWADLDGDRLASLVAGTREEGVVAFDGDGEERWRYTGEEDGRPIRLQGPLATADVNGDGRVALFVVEEGGVLCLDETGRSRWRIETGDRFMSGCVVADTDDDGIYEVYALSSSAPALYAIDADVGELLWRLPWPPFPDPGNRMPLSRLAVADLNHDGHGEILVGDSGGRVTAVSSDGQVLWRFTGSLPGLASITAGDVTGDGGVEVLVAMPDALYCLDGGGRELWRYAIDGAPWHAPVLSDLQENGRTVLVLGGNRALRALSSGGRYHSVLMPWPAAGGNPAQTGGWLRQDLDGPPEETGLFWESKGLLNEGGFDHAAPVFVTTASVREERPRGWQCETPLAGEWQLDSETKLGGAASVRVSARRDPLVLVSDAVAVPRDLHRVSGQVMGRETGTARAGLRWYGAQGILREDAFRSGTASDTGWQRFTLSETAPPVGARTMRLALIAEDSGGAPLWWDEAQLTGDFERAPAAGVFVNQVGFDTNRPKFFTAYSNFRPDQARFVLYSDSGERVFEGRLHQGVTITAGQGRDWGYTYWRGDFSEYREAGAYRIRVYFDSISEYSPDFQIQPNLIWKETVPVVLSFLNAQRCGMAVPGIHEACHLKDADGDLPLHGGWHDGGHYDKRDTPSCLRDLAFAYSVAWRQFEESGGVAERLLEEMRWGAAYVARSVREDGSVAPAPISNPDFWDLPDREPVRWTGGGAADSRDTGEDVHPSVHASALARLVRFGKVGEAEKSEWRASAERALAAAVSGGHTGPDPFNAAMDLFLVTKDAKYGELAKALYPGLEPASIENLLEYESAFDVLVTFDLASKLIEMADRLVKEADNPFGVCVYAGPEGTSYFGGANEFDAPRGNTGHLLEMANLVAKAYRFNPAPEYLVFIYDQLNWILGNNPYGISLIEGLGTKGAPSYYHRYGAGRLPRGAVPGAIANGIAAQGPGDDRPFFDVSGAERPNPGTNGVSIRNNALYIDTLSNLARLRLGG